jgi:hypothetical protein
MTANGKVSFDQALVAELCKKYGLPGMHSDWYAGSGPKYRDEGREIVFEDALPQLPFLTELAQLHGLQPDDLEVSFDIMEYGAYVEFTVREIP